MPPPPAAAIETTTLDRLVRGARDRLLDLLLLGETAPLQDVPARVDVPIVTFGGTAQVLVEESQSDVVYELRGEDGAVRTGPGGAPLDAPAPGTGGTITFPLTAVEEEVTFTVLARKRTVPRPLPLSGRSAVLHARPSIRVGLATGLATWIRPGPPDATAPPLIDFGTPVEVEIAESQEGVDYRLVSHRPGEPANPTDLGELTRETVVSEVPWTRGHGGNIVLRSTALAADTLIRVRCLKAFEGGRRDTQLLTRALPVLVRANPAVPAVLVTEGPVPVVAYRVAPVVRVAPTQQSVAYRAWWRTLREAEFRPGATGAGLVRIPLAGQAPDDVVLTAPAPPTDWPEPAGFTAAGKAVGPAPASIDLPLPALVDDALVVVEARKIHDPAIAGADGPVTSSLALRAIPVILVRPDPGGTGLHLGVEVASDGTRSKGPITVEGGQPGVRYTLSVMPNGPALSRPAYVHRRDEMDSRRNKGIDGLWLEIDFAIAADPADPLAVMVPPAERPPVAPRLDAPDLPIPTQIGVTATKARTGVSVPLTATAQLVAPPAAEVLTPGAAAGAPARVVVRASRAQEGYALIAGGTTGPVTTGTGGDLELSSPPLGPDRALQLRILQTDGNVALPVERRLSLPLAG